MNYSIVFNSQIESDLTESYDYYEHQIQGLGFDFLLSVEATLNLIKRKPLHFQKIYKNKRKDNVRRFPFGIFYVVSDEQIDILAIIHLTRDPKTWRSRKK